MSLEDFPNFVRLIIDHAMIEDISGCART